MQKKRPYRPGANGLLFFLIIFAMWVIGTGIAMWQGKIVD